MIKSTVSNNNLSQSMDINNYKHYKSYGLYEEARSYLKEEGPRLCSKVKYIYNFRVEKDGEIVYFTLDLKNKPGTIEIGKHPRADATVFTSDTYLDQMYQGKLDPTRALFQKKLVVRGNPIAIIKFKPSLLGMKPNL